MASKHDGRYLVGITGNIGSGKTTVSKLFEEFGAIRISADELAKKYSDPGTPIKEELRQIFGDVIFDENGNPIKSKIAELAFTDKSKLEAMNALIHPLVRKDFRTLIEKSPEGSVIAWEVPLLFETDAHLLCDKTVCVYLDHENAWSRVESRGGMKKEDYEHRSLAQLPLDKKKSLSDFSIPNDNSIEELRILTKRVFDSINDLAKGFK